jgi:excisionase family DNA binding protein
MSHTRLKERKQRAFLTVTEAAQTLDVSPETIRRRMDDGLLKGYRLAGVRRVFASEVNRLLEAGERP